jgi:hypothetical protein
MQLNLARILWLHTLRIRGVKWKTVRIEGTLSSHLLLYKAVVWTVYCGSQGTSCLIIDVHVLREKLSNFIHIILLLRENRVLVGSKAWDVE